MFDPTKNKWYKQSCAGNMLYLSMPWLSIKERMEKASGFVFPNAVFILVNENGRVIMGHYIDYDQDLKQAEKILKTMEEKPEVFQVLAKVFYAGGVAMIKAGEKLIKVSADDPDFKKLYEDFVEQNHLFWENSLYLDLLDPFEEMAITHIFGEKVKQLSKQDMNLLLSPKDPSNLQKEQVDMLEIFELAKANGRDSQEVTSRLGQHSTNYHWIKNDYEKVSHLDASYYFGVLDTWLSNPILADEARKVISKMEELGKAKAALIQSLNLDDKIMGQLEIMNLFTNLRDDRKKYNCISSYYFDCVAGHVAKSIGIDPKLVLWANVYELPRLLSEPGLLVELQKRDQYGSLSYTDNGKLVFETGEQVRGIYDQFEAGLQKSEIRGNVANPGKAIGIAKIILNQDDFSKMGKDDILVAAMTRPEYLPILKLAAAIITDEGGITCHAAIVARELGIPCVIGTQVATKMLKDGDKVEVNANHGTVIKL